MAGYKDFTSGSVLAAADLEDYCELQGIMRFASAAARTTALSGVLTEGLMCYLVDLNVIQVYSGSAWSTIGPVHGVPTSWTPTVTQSGSVTVTNTKSVYTRTGRWVQFQAKLTVSGSGTGSNDIVIGNLPATAATAALVVGQGFVFDTSATANWFGQVYLASTTTLVMPNTFAGGATGSLGSTGFTAGLAAGDIINICGAYEAASDN